MKKNLVPYNTNLASEFWVLSALYRLGVEAHLTLGNKKSVDILILSNSKAISTVDVKGVADPYDWPADINPIASKNYSRNTIDLIVQWSSHASPQNLAG